MPKNRVKKRVLFVVAVIFIILIVYYYHVPDLHRNMAYIKGGTFVMGSESRLAKNNEKPAHKVYVDSFWMDKTDVTNAQFATFVKATGYITTAERVPDWETLKVQLPAGAEKPSNDQLVPGAMVFVGTQRPVSLDDASQWWRYIPGANWRHPKGPGSDINGKEDYPVVQVSYEDAQAYAAWCHKRLPTEAEWEYAARGGFAQADFTWGHDHALHRKMANTFAGREFPVIATATERTKIGTTKVGSYPANRYGLYDMAGNVWQWTSDWYRADAYSYATQVPLLVNPQGPKESYDPADPWGAPAHAPKRVIRGGSFLCEEHFCLSYRTSARRGVDPYNAMSHIGFRLVMDAKPLCAVCYLYKT
jgi:formylglycine-generating enzyme